MARYRCCYAAFLLVLTLAPRIAYGQTHAQEDGRFSVVFRGAPLDDALGEVVRLTGIDLVFNTELVAHRQAYCVRQRVPAEEVLRCVLAGNGLDFVRSSSGAYVLVVAPRQRPVTARLAGRVVDARSGEPMPHAHVLLASAATSADTDGFFVIGGVEPGWHRIMATHVGYRPFVLDDVWIAPGATERIVVRIEPAPTDLTPVVIDGLSQRLPSAQLGTVAESAAPVASFVATPDVIRGPAATLGVSSALPLAHLHVQGGQTSEHVTRLDGVPVRDPVALGRFLGAFSPMAIAGVTVHKAGFGVAHGSQLTGVVDLHHDLYRDGSTLTAQVDPVSLNAWVAVPLRARRGLEGRLMLAYRHSNWGLLQDAGLVDLLERSNTVDPLLTSNWLRQPVLARDIQTLAHHPEVAFSDGHLAVHLRPDIFTTLNASLYRAGNFVATDHRAALRGGESVRQLDFRDEYDWTNWAGQVRTSRLIGARAVAAVRARGSHHASSYVYNYGSDGAYAAGGQERTVAEALAAHRLLEVGVDSGVSLSLGMGHDIEFGVSADLIDARFEALNAFVPAFETAAREALLGGYVEGRLGLGGRWSLEGGNRLTVVPKTGRVYAEPRAALRVDGALQGTDGFAVRVAGGLYRQFVNGFAFRSAGPASLVPELWFWLPTTRSVHPPRAFHLALDGLLLPTGGWTLRAETYARWEPHLLALDTPALVGRDSDASDTRMDPEAVVTSANGYALGMGIGVRKEGRTVSGTLNYSLEHARRTAPALRRNAALTVPWGEPHRASASARIALGGGCAVEAAGRGIWGRTWGLRGAYYDYLSDPGRGPVLRRTSRPDQERLPPLLLLDGRLACRRSARGTRVRLEVGVANLLDRDNVVDWSLDGPMEARDTVPRLLPRRHATFAVQIAR